MNKNVKLLNPDDRVVFDSALVISGPSLEKKQIIDDRGVYKLCFSVRGAKKSDATFRVSFSIDYRNRGADPSKKVGRDAIPALESQFKGNMGNGELCRGNKMSKNTNDDAV